nr:hypothetical protein [Tanacetum cinerariifolium]
MTNLTFADSHNMVAYLEKLAENADFAEIVYFLNANLISINITTAEPITTVSAPVTTAGVSVSTAEPSTPPTTKTTLIEDEDLIIAQTLMKMRSVKSKEKSKEKGVSSTRLTRGEPEKPVKVKGKDQIALCEEVTQRLEAQMQVKFEEEERLQVEEQRDLTIKERSKQFVKLMDQRKKHFAKLRAKEIRRKPPTKAQKRNQMCTYLKNMANYKHKVLEGSGKRAKNNGKEAVKKGIDIYMLVEKEYPLLRGTLTLMLVAKLMVDQDNEMSKELLRKIFMQGRIVRFKRLLSAIEVTADMEVTTAGSSYNCWLWFLLLILYRVNGGDFVENC